MKKLIQTLSFPLLFASVAMAQSTEDAQTVYRTDPRGIAKGSAEFFTGDVQVERLFPANETASYSGAYVTFQPGARTAWHQHPAGQHMIVTSGIALTGTRDGNSIRFAEGDTVWCPPGVDHWHGATPDAAMTHLVITGTKSGQNVIWKEKVTNEHYRGAAAENTKEKTMNANEALSQRQQAIIPIAAFTASGDLDRLKPALAAGLDSGLTVNEIKEVLVQMYAYTGFPRSLNGINTFMVLTQEREAAGIQDPVGKEASPVSADLNRDAYGAKVRARLSGLETIPPPSAYQRFVPIIDTFLKEHLFADIFARDVLSDQERELATISALAAMTGTEAQLRFHLGATMNTGLTEAQMHAFVSVLGATVGPAQAASAQKILTEVLAARIKPDGTQ